MLKKLHLGISYSNYRKSKLKEKSWKKPERKKHKARYMLKKLHLGISYSNYRKSKLKEKSWKKPERKKLHAPYLYRSKDKNYIQLLRNYEAGRHGSEIFKVVRKNNTNLEFLTLQNYRLKLKVMNRQSTVDF